MGSAREFVGEEIRTSSSVQRSSLIVADEAGVIDLDLCRRVRCSGDEGPPLRAPLPLGLALPLSSDLPGLKVV